MAKSTYKYLSLSDFRGGINMEPENAQRNQVLDARNVWAPKGTLEQRPGLLPASNSPQERNYLTLATTKWAWIASNESTVISSATSGTLATAAGAGAVGSYLYIGFTVTDSPGIRAVHGLQGSGHDVPSANATPYPANAALTRYSAEYYTGTEWKRFPVWQTIDGAKENSTNRIVADATPTYFLAFYGYGSASANVSINFNWTPPNDWAVANPATLGSYYWLRFKVLSAAVDALNITQVANLDILGPVIAPTGLNRLSYALPAGFGQARFDGGFIGYWKLYASPSGTTPEVLYVSSTNRQFLTQSATGIVKLTTGTRPSVATLPQFRKMFVAWMGDIFESTYATGAFSSSLAQVETDSALVGTNAPYDPNLVAQLSAPPKAYYITSYNGVLFAARMVGEDGGDSLVRWSGAGQAFRVWPEENFADLAEDDNSPITGLTSLNEAPIVFKQDSIWNMEYTGTSELDEGNSGGLPIFTPRKIVSGIGCVSNSSIARTPIGLIFLAEDGFYVYDGRQATKISSQIDPMIQRISGKAAELASAVYWQTRNAYLIALPIDGAGENNIILVYDLKHNAWWFWDSTDAQVLANIEDSADKEQIQFVDKYGRIMQFQDGKDDYGYTPTAYVETHRIAGDGNSTITCREIRVNSEGSASQLSVQVIPDDDVNSATTGTLDYADGNSAEAVYGTAVYGTDVYTPTKRKERYLGFRKRGTWFRVKVSLAVAFVKMVVHKITAGVVLK